MVNYNVTGSARKKLVKKLSALVGESARYMGMPSMAFQVGSFSVSASGEISGGELPGEIKAALARAGFTPASEPTVEEEAAPAEGMVVRVPLESLPDNAIRNFENMVASKGALIKKAFGLQELPVECTDDALEILWFKDREPEDRGHAEAFIRAMLDKCRNQRYVSSKPLETDNERYSMRVFINSLGFKGSGHKALRAGLLKHLDGNTAWRHGKPGEG